MSIISILQGFRKGVLVQELSEKTKEVVKGVRETGKAGEITLKLTFKSDGDGQHTLVPKITTKVPQAETPPAIFFSDDEGDLFRSDPRQGDFVDELEERRSAQKGE